MEKTAAKVSVLTSVYNNEKYMSQWFESVCGQTFRDLEMVVVDDASSDNSLQIIGEYARRDNRIKVIRHEKNRGPAAGYQSALDNATGEFFTYVDHDDYIDANYIQTLYDAIVDEGADVSMCVNDVVYPDGRSDILYPWPPKGKYVISGERARLLPCQLFDRDSDKYFGFPMPNLRATWIKMVRTDFVRRCGARWNEALVCELDSDFWLQILLHVKKLVYTTDAVYHFYQGEGSVTRSGGGLNLSKALTVFTFMDSVERQVRQHAEVPGLDEAALGCYTNILVQTCHGFHAHRRELSKPDRREIRAAFKNSPAVQRLFAAKNLRFLKFSQRMFLAFCKRGCYASAVRFTEAYWKLGDLCRKLLKRQKP